MEKAIYLLAATAIICIGLNSCTAEDTKMEDLTLEAVETNLESGSWHIALFEDSGKDETNHFSGYDFTFEGDGTLKAENGSNTILGTWNIRDSKSRDDSQDDLDFNIFFNVSNDFEDLNEDWNILSNTEMKIELIHISGGDGSTEYLTFERN